MHGFLHTPEPDEDWVRSLSEGGNSRPVKRLKSFMGSHGWTSVANKPRTSRRTKRRRLRELTVRRERDATHETDEGPGQEGQ